MTTIEAIVEKKKALLSGELAHLLAEANGIEINAARKRVERAKSPVHKIKGLFADNQSFVYHSSAYNSGTYFDELVQSFEKAATRCAVLLEAIDYHHGLIDKNELANYAMSPVHNIIGHMNFYTIVDKLIELNVLSDYDDNLYTLNGYISPAEPNISHFKAIQLAKKLLLQNLKTWSGHIGLGSFNAGTFDSVVAGFQFAYTAPSYLHGFVKYKDGVPQPGFLVADILIGNVTSTKSIHFFLQKLAVIRASNKGIRLLPVLIVDGLEPEAFQALRKAGVMIGSVKELFGDNYNELIKDLIATITNAGTILKKDPEKYIHLMTQLTKLVDGKTNNLKGELFELAVGYYYGQHCQFLEIGKKVVPEPWEKKRDIDVMALYQDEVRIVECKGYNYPVDVDYVDRYLGEILPAIFKWQKKTFPEKKCAFELWSTGGFTAKALEKLDEARSKTKKYSVNYLQKPDILAKAAELKTSKFSEILKEYFFKDVA
ncbi:hypothetical protein ACFS5N_05860 [Mucilaginibacter ximonensis]|uniref:Restriction endonuclease n=1 Tax=Mucilaginibacter ximonensis TaxID=538021 RepID=A0ABW5YAH6_9SPHI